MARRLGKGSDFLMDLENRDLLFFEHFPDELTDTVAANWNTIDVIGRSAPIKGYSSTGARTISLDLDFAISIEGQDQLFDRPVDDQLIDDKKVYDSVCFCRSLVYPEYGDPLGRPGYRGDFTFPPPRVLLVIGSFLKMVAVVNSCDVTWKRPYTQTGQPMFATVSLAFEAITNNPPSRVDVRRGYDIDVFTQLVRGI